MSIRNAWHGYLQYVVLKAMMSSIFIRHRCNACGKRHSDIEAMAGMTCVENVA